MISASLTPDRRLEDSSAGANVSVARGESAGVDARLLGWYCCDADAMRFMDVIVGALCDELVLSRIEAGSESRTLLSCSSNGIIGDLGDLTLLEGDAGVGEDLPSISENGEEVERDVSVNTGSTSIPFRFRMAQFKGGFGPFVTRSRTRNKGESSGSCLSSDASDFAEERREVRLWLFA